MYPCADSSQSTAFRLAILKYLEGAREKALSAAAVKVNSNSKPKGADRPRAISITSKPLQRPTHQPSTSDTTGRRTKVTIKPPLPRINSSKTRASPTATSVAAPGSRTTSSASSITLLNPPQSESQKASKPPANGWWWRHVVIRKAILEECTGEQFERLLLALSVHALMGQSTYQFYHGYCLSNKFIKVCDFQVVFKGLLQLLLSSYVPGSLKTDFIMRMNPRRIPYQLYQSLMLHYSLVLSTISHTLVIRLLYWTRGRGKCRPFKRLWTIPISIRKRKILQLLTWRLYWKLDFGI